MKSSNCQILKIEKEQDPTLFCDLTDRKSMEDRSNVFFSYAKYLLSNYLEQHRLLSLIT
jgi:hypothetical protein